MQQSPLPRWMVLAPSLGLVLTLSLVGYLGSRLLRLEARVDALQATAEAPQPARVARAASVREGSAPRVSSRPVPQGGSAAWAGRGTAASEDAVVTQIDDHLWSEGGREAIGDVVEAREEADRERISNRWKRMSEYRTQKAVDAVSEQLDLSAEQTEAVTALVADYMEVRGSRWKKMSADEDVDIEALEREYETAKEAVEQDLIGVLGEDGLELLREEIKSGWR